MAAYHLRAEAEKGAAVAGVDGLPDRYWARSRTAGRVRRRCRAGGPERGCCRGLCIASGLIGAALAQAVECGVGVARLSEWRAGAIALYERFGFAGAESWDVRDQLVCVQRAV